MGQVTTRSMTTLDVHGLGNEFGVAGAHTMANTAEMVIFQAMRGSPFKDMVGEGRAAADAKAPITVFVNVSCPEQTRTKVWTMGRNGTFLNLRPKALLRRAFRSLKQTLGWVSSLLPSAVMETTPAATSGCLFTALNGAGLAFVVLMAQLLRIASASPAEIVHRTPSTSDGQLAAVLYGTSKFGRWENPSCYCVTDRNHGAIVPQKVH